MLSGQFAGSVYRQGIGGVVFDIRRALFAVEHEIRAVMDKPDGGAPHNAAQQGRKGFVDGIGFVGVLLGVVHGGVGDGVEHVARIEVGDARFQPIRGGDGAVFASQGAHGPALGLGGPRQGLAKHARGSAQHQGHGRQGRGTRYVRGGQVGSIGIRCVHRRSPYQSFSKSR